MSVCEERNRRGGGRDKGEGEKGRGGAGRRDRNKSQGVVAYNCEDWQGLTLQGGL